MMASVSKVEIIDQCKNKNKSEIVHGTYLGVNAAAAGAASEHSQGKWKMNWK